MLTAADGLERILLECMGAMAADPAARRDVAAQIGGPIDYTALEIAVLRLRWLGEQLSARGGVALMRNTLETVIRQNVAGPWLQSIADTHWQGIGTWSAPPAPIRGPMG